jgi:hypothetical protein
MFDWIGQLPDWVGVVVLVAVVLAGFYKPLFGGRRRRRSESD